MVIIYHNIFHLIFHQILCITKFVTKLVTECVTKYDWQLNLSSSLSLYLSSNAVYHYICHQFCHQILHQIWWQIRHKIPWGSLFKERALKFCDPESKDFADVLVACFSEDNESLERALEIVNCEEQCAISQNSCTPGVQQLQ